MTDLHLLSAAQALDKLRRGEISAAQLVGACLAQIGKVDGGIGAWQFIDPDYALAQAAAIDEHRLAGRPIGPLHGLPVAVKDIIDTQDMPTENGTPLHAGRRPGEDATVVAKLRSAGAIVLGKTVTTELAYFAPGKTRNPRLTDHTPGGSSSGSAAAVAAHMAPLAIGSQTAGSVIRPASFCGVCGFKPSHGMISRHGVLALSRALDTMGVFARTVEDVALFADQLVGHDPNDPDTRLQSRAGLVELVGQAPPVAPLFAMVTQPAWDRASADLQAGFDELGVALADHCDRVDLPPPFERGLEIHRTIMAADIARSLAGLYQRGADQLSDRLRQVIEEGRRVLAYDYTLALDWVNLLNAGLDEIFERYDAIITPAALGEAPQGLDHTGDPVYCSLWTLCGVPAVTLPLLEGDNGLPIGVQIIGPRGDDGRLLRTARWLAAHLTAPEPSEQSLEAAN